MGIFNVLTNVTKATVAVVASPVALVADICMLPSSALDNTEPFARTSSMLNAAGKCISEAVAPKKGQP